MRSLAPPDRLIVFAGEQLWAPIDALAQWGDRLAQAHLLVMHGGEVAGGPADRLRDFIRASFPRVEVVTHKPLNDDAPSELLERLDAIVTTEGRWLVDASGATRLLFAGLAQAVAAGAAPPVIHREPDGPWYELGPAGEARLLDDVDVDAAERFTVEDLLTVTWGDEDRQARVLHSEVEPEVMAAARRAWDGVPWEEAFDTAVAQLEAAVGRSLSKGRLFETFVVSLVREMGIDADDVAISASLFDGSIPVQEVDVVVNSHGRLHVVDCKLTSEKDDEKNRLSIGDQIRTAYATRRLLGDGGDQFILLRPQRVVPEHFRRLCRDYDIQVIDQAVLEEESLPAALERLLRGGGRAVGPRMTRTGVVRVPVRSQVVEVHAEFVQSREPVRVYDLEPVCAVKVSTTANVPDLRRRMTRVVGDRGEVVGAYRNHGSKRQATILVRPFHDHRDELLALLAALTVETLEGRRLS
ncbi:MAG: hypothetical protein QM621_01850 [Aeromicrobium sp.]|uniref:hypothetical protein n=1 Tax=Aeromicrobium sp. TaxID=1871063 RepID=UPI0039E433DC